MKKIYKIVRAILVTLLALAFLVPVSAYVLLSLPGVQRGICHRVERELTTLLDMRVNVNAVAISPFNRVTLHHIAVQDSLGDTAIAVDRVGAGINLFDFFVKRRIVLNYAEVLGLDARIKRDSAGTPLNIQPLITALAPKDKNKPPTQFNIAIRTVVIRNCSVSYDVLSAPRKEKGIDPNHLSISRLRADVNLPQLKNDDFIIDLRRLALSERSGLQLTDLNGLFHITSGGVDVSGLELRLPRTQLSFSDIAVRYKSTEWLSKNWPTIPLNLELQQGSHINPADMAWAVPMLENLDFNADISLHVEGTPRHFEMKRLELMCQKPMFDLKTHGTVTGIGQMEKEIEADIPDLTLTTSAPELTATITTVKPLGSKVTDMANALGIMKLTAEAHGTPSRANVAATLTTSPGTINMEVEMNRSKAKVTAFKGNLEIKDFQAATMLQPFGGAAAQTGNVDMQAKFDIALQNGMPKGSVEAFLNNITYRGHTYQDITADVEIDGTKYSGNIESDTPGLDLYAYGEFDANKTLKSLRMELDIDDINLANLGALPKYEGYSLSASGTAQLCGTSVDDIAGEVALRNIDFLNDQGHGIAIDSIMAISVVHADAPDTITVHSPILTAQMNGEYKLSTLVKSVKAMIAKEFPALFPHEAAYNVYAPELAVNNFDYKITLLDTDPIAQLVKLPVSVIYPIEINGNVSTIGRKLSLNVDAPYLQQKDKLIENTSVRFDFSGDSMSTAPATLWCTTQMPTKKGDMILSLNANGGNDRLDTQMMWNVRRERTFKGNVNLTAEFSRPDTVPNGGIATTLHINPGNVVFNDTAWHISPARIDIYGKRAEIKDFRVGHDGQYITASGIASTNPTDTVLLNLDDVNLDYVFETLGIEAAMFGGNATGRFYATDLFTKLPRAYTPDLHVKRFSYNGTVLGDTHIRSEWVPETKTITLKADVTEESGKHSYVDGRILPTCDSLDFHFKADKLPIGFLRPFMSAFADNISGYASGEARLWGTFKLIDMVGDVYGEDVSLKLGFTNTTYTTSGKVSLTPGRIDLRNLTLHDIYGNTAQLNGWLKHEFFKSPSFNFSITDASNMLVYDVPENTETNWFGTIYGNGSASVTGRPGIVNIGVNMRTAPKSTFTFVLSDVKVANDYTFITFRDKDQARKDSIANHGYDAVVKQLKKRIAQSVEQSAPTIYNMNISVDVTPQAEVILVMDPVGGDKIRAFGQGNLRMSYNSANEDLHMYGTYTLDRGSYNFTLQDIIIKPFTIREGSSIVFHGDPYAAQLDIKASYNVNANLSDLDESFLEDKDLNRTSVPVHAMLLVTGDMRQPDINFDLEFPTLTSDVVRKVRSIISTDEMMNRQIIYLLALNRFYTPDYVSATKGNELVSVASSTLSSQLGNILGQLSDNWNIAPNLRSDRGDFSDVQFDVALSSHLLNNRLLLNGNLGYRDNTLNNNSFIGDFDIEYLLNRSGSIRLKAYNRYNDQNYYVKSALTTQGVGVVFKRDFDDILSFLKPIRRWLTRKKTQTADTTKTTPAEPQEPAPTTAE